MRSAHRAIAVAFDGLVAETLDLRAGAAAEGLRSIGMPADIDVLRAFVAGSTPTELIRDTLALQGIEDETAVDIATMRASTLLAMSMQHGVLLAPHAIDWIERASLRTRVIIRADSERRFVEQVLNESGLADRMTFIVCSDDARSAGAGKRMFDQTWMLLTERCRGLGVSENNLHGLECALDETCSRVSAVRLHRVMSVTEVAIDALQLF